MSESMSNFDQFEFKTLDIISVFPIVGMGAGVYRVCEGVIHFGIAIIRTLNSAFDSKEGTTSTEALKILKSLNTIKRGLAETTPVGFIFALVFNAEVFYKKMKKIAELDVENSFENAFEVIDKGTPFMDREETAHLINKMVEDFIEEEKPFLAANLVIKFIEYYNKHHLGGLSGNYVAYGYMILPILQQLEKASVFTCEKIILCEKLCALLIIKKDLNEAEKIMKRIKGSANEINVDRL